MQSPPLYIIKDLNNEFIAGKFYEEVLQKKNTKQEEIYTIDKILRKRQHMKFFTDTFLLCKYDNEDYPKIATFFLLDYFIKQEELMFNNLCYNVKMFQSR